MRIRAGPGALDAALRAERLRTGNNLNHSINPFTVSVYPIQQEPGLWFANYMISEYMNGAERIVANVSMRHVTHCSEAAARHATRRAGESAAALMLRQQLRHRRARSAQLAA
ncbi:conserved hypothetical protein (plasmid) [Ralstonia solanacearum Po82]|uniref:Uncharacterized protein n=2 Tax=Ralstonia solanacearum TaxID=305 RepID=A0A5H2Q2Q6_RALSL|nr:conserved hypothetical protein [Ralstonia solanacearum Po82]AYB62479.1 hypothetical protein C2124_18150 [Ralstonia solanacearum]EUJ13032.1 hypothetical protein RSP673_18050 [Ralstonia solanacearum P673]QJC23759.1 hypothetical protein G8D25_06175 [Ralstonia solanacearum]